MTKEESRRYEIRLRDETRWVLDGDETTGSFMTELSRIMMLSGAMTHEGPSITACSFAEDDREWGAVAPLQGAQESRRPSPWCFLGPVVEVRIESTSGLDKYLSMSHLLFPVYEQSIRKGGLPAHSALAEINGKGLLIAASGGTGKSTCMRRLPEGWKALCDDEALIVRDREGRYHVHPFPTWTDYIWQRAENRWDVQYSVPLQALFFLEQADVDDVSAIGPGETAMLAYQASIQVCNKYIPRLDQPARNRFVRQIFDNACDLAQNIPGYRLKATLDGHFWENMERVIL